MRRYVCFALLLALCIVVAVAWIEHFSRPSTRYRVLGMRSQLRNVIMYEIDNGDSVDDVERLLGEWEHMKSRNWVKAQMLSADAPDFSKRYPDGICEDDVFVAYQGGFHQYVLQFRNGILINHCGEKLRALETKPQSVQTNSTTR